MIISGHRPACTKSQPPTRPPTRPSAPHPWLRATSLQIVEAVAPVREKLDACVVFPSMPAVMKLNKLGTFNMSQLGQSKSLIGGRGRQCGV